jgi:alpha-galactosidase
VGRILASLSAIALAAGLTTATIATAPAAPAYALGDGLALTPPMGFNNWNSTHCRADFDETMVKGIADIFVARGLKDAGYQYVNIDDCWALPERGADGNLVPDPVRFPNGIKAVADYVHDKGLKFGIYTSAGTKTCNKDGGFPGGLGHEKQDANLFASWGVDYLKYDNCNNQNVDAQQRYKAMRDALKATGRPIVYSLCEWGVQNPWEWGANVGHLWRTTGDISDNWSSMLGIVKQNAPLDGFAGPGHWNDPDMLEIGNGGMTGIEYRSHFSLWSIMAAPLLIGSDLRNASDATLAILSNREVIAVDQDRAGMQGTRVRSSAGREVWVRRLANGDRALLLFSRRATAGKFTVDLASVGLGGGRHAVRDLWNHRTATVGHVLRATVVSHGVAMFRIRPA